MDNSRRLKTAKFGGTSLADANQFEKVINIIRSDLARRCIVVSAPGKRNPRDEKVTDLLYAWIEALGSYKRGRIFTKISARFKEIVVGLGLDPSFIEKELAEIEMHDLTGANARNFAASRGDYLNALIVAKLLGYKFVDAKDFIRFNPDGTLNLAETKRLAHSLCLKGLAEKIGIVVPGFYGLMPDGTIRTFSRNGSDITGSIVAACTDSKLYENWTDVPGVMMADPRIVANPKRIDTLTYSELGELAFRGADVLHHESISPVRGLGIPINIRNTNCPEDDGTMIVPKIEHHMRAPGSIVGIAGRNGFSVVTIIKASMRQETGFFHRVSGVMEKHGINIENIPGELTTLDIIVETSKFNKVKEVVLRELEEACRPDTILVGDYISLVCIVGSLMAKVPGTSARIFGAIAKAGINVKLISQGLREINVIVGIDEKDYRSTVQAVYNEFIN